MGKNPDRFLRRITTAVETSANTQKGARIVKLNSQYYRHIQWKQIGTGSMVSLGGEKVVLATFNAATMKFNVMGRKGPVGILTLYNALVESGRIGECFDLCDRSNHPAR